MVATRSSKFLAFFFGLLVAVCALAVFAVPAHAALVAVQADDGASITEPSDGKAFDLGKSVVVKVNAKYTRPDGFSIFNPPKNYIYLRVIKNGAQVGELLEKDFTGIPGFVTAVTLPSFTPETEGAYIIEVHHDYTYDANKVHVELDPAHFAPDNNENASRTIIVQKDISKAETQISGLAGTTYTGQAHTPEPTVTVDGEELDPDTDYDVAYASNVNVGQATVTVTGKGFYKGSKTATFNVVPADISTATMSGVVDKDYSRNPVTQTPSVVWNGRLLSGDGETPDYELAYVDNTNAGTATITAIGKGNFTGELSRTFKINRVSICSLGDPGVKNKTYTGQPITQDISFWYGGNVVEGTDFTTTYKNNVNPGTATVTITGAGNFKDSIVRTFSIFEPTSSGVGARVTSPADKSQFAVGSEITTKAVAGIFENSVTWVGTSGPYMGVDWNYMYFRVLRRDATTGATETVLFGGGENGRPLTYPSASSEVSLTFTADKKGEYQIQVCRQGVRVGADNKIIFIEESNFNPTDSITVYVGVTAPNAKTPITNAQISGVVDKTYTGNSITQNPTVKLGDKTLKNGTDYYITYAGMYSGGTNTVDHGTVTMSVHGTGSYTGTVSRTFQILQKPLAADMIVVTPTSFSYNGGPQTPSVVVMNGTFKLSNTVDYDLDIQEGTEPGTYKIVATTRENRNYTGSATAYYTINKWSIAGAAVSCEPAGYTYDGQAKEPAVTAMLDGVVLPADAYDVSYSKNTNAGTATATITAKADSYYTGSASTTFSIAQLGIATDAFSVAPIQAVTYNRKAQTPVPQLMWGETALCNGTDYTVAYANNTNAGTATATITGKGNFRGSRSVTFAIGRKSIADASVTIDPVPYQRYADGAPITPVITVRDGNAALTSDEFEFEYANNAEIGTATVTVRGLGNYTGSRADVEFRILEATAYAQESLSDAIAAIEGEGIDGYLDADKTALQAAIDAAKALLNDELATVEGLEDALAAIESLKAQAQLNLAMDELSQTIAGVEKALGSYLGPDKAILQAAITAAKTLMETEGVTPESLREALATITSAQQTAKTNLAAAQKAAREKAEREAAERAKAAADAKAAEEAAAKAKAAAEPEKAKKKALSKPSAAAVAKKLTSQKKDADPAGSSFTQLKLKSPKQGKKYISLKWSKVAGAASYVVYANKCGKNNKLKKIATVKKTSFKHKKLKKGTYFKYIVVAVQDTVVGERAAAVSKMIHVATKGGKVTNAKKVSLKVKVGKAKAKKAKTVTVKKGKTAKLVATFAPASKKLTVKKHVKMRFESAKPGIAKVSKKGVVKGVSRGTCYVYAYAQNGIAAKVKVRVK